MSFRAAREIQQKKVESHSHKKSSSNAASTPSSLPHPPTTAAFSRSHTVTPVEPTSRLCVKNLPVEVKEDKLRQHFGEKGEVTDVKLLKTADGRSRKMAFIGYRTVEAATKAIAHFNKTFLGTSKIDVEYAINPREAKEAIQPWSRHSEGSSRYAEQHRDRSGDKDAAAAATGAPVAEPTDPASVARKLASKSSTFAKSGLFGLSSNKELAKLLTDPKFKQYLYVMGSRSKNKFWSNIEEDNQGGDMTQAEIEAIKGDKSYQTYEEYLASEKGGDKKSKKKGGADEDDEEDDEYFNQPMLERDVDEEMGEEKKEEKAEKGKKTSSKKKSTDDEDMVDVPVDPLLLNSAVSDLDYLKSKQATKDFDDDSDMEDAAPTTATTATTRTSTKRKAADDEEGGKDEKQDQDDEDDSDLKAAYEQDQQMTVEAPKTVADEIMDTGRLFLRNLSYSVTEADLRELFTPFGSISEIHLPVDELKKPKGFAHVSFMFPAQALAAQRSLDGQFFLGRLLHILQGRPKPVVKSEWEKLQEASDDVKNSMTYKKKKELETQALAGSKKDQASWNALFIRSDTVTESIASKYGLSKADIMDTSAGSDQTGMAVRLALAESTLIGETKSFLKEHGVDLTVFDQPKANTKRSDTVILVKNIPFNTELDELRRLFSSHGTLGHVVMPPSRTMAMIEFIESNEAKKAFKSLAYKKFKYVPLYLEWAPAGAFGLGGDNVTNINTKTGGVIEGKKSVVDEAAGAAVDDETSSSSESSTVYVKNLNFATTDDGLKTIFQTIGPIRSATVSMKKNTKARPHTNDPAFLSMGYGFVEYRSAADAKKAIQQLQGVQLDNHALELKLSSRGTNTNSASTATKPRTAAAAAHVAAAASSSAATASSGSAVPSSKLLVKNVPFETTARELRELFSSFGTIQRIRLPKKFGQLGHRGFAFIDFVTKAEAKNAMENVKHSHLYGRHLVIEYAASTIEQDSQDVDGLRKKTAEQFKTTSAGAPPNKKRKVTGDEGDEIDQAFDKQFK